MNLVCFLLLEFANFIKLRLQNNHKNNKINNILMVIITNQTLHVKVSWIRIFFFQWPSESTQ